MSLIRKYFTYCFLTGFLFIPFLSFSQVNQHNYNGWYMYFGDHKLGSKLGIHLEAQWRSRDIILTPNQLLLRPAINYELNENLMLTGGYGFIVSRINLSPGYEHRIFEQAQIKHNIGKVMLVHRYRLEQRFFEFYYANRARYMLRVNVPLSQKFYLGFYDEAFIAFGKSVFDHFDQNRAYAALGIKLGKYNKLELGYLNQLLPRGLHNDVNHTLQIGLFSTMPFIKVD